VSDSRCSVVPVTWLLTRRHDEELRAKLAELEKQVQGRKRGNIDFKVSEKGGVSVYGLGRFPVTLYYEQWVRLLDQTEQLREFMEANKSRLKMKGTEG
jgi:hypothetical protein